MLCYTFDPRYPVQITKLIILDFFCSENILPLYIFTALIYCISLYICKEICKTVIILEREG